MISKFFILIYKGALILSSIVSYIYFSEKTTFFFKDISAFYAIFKYVNYKFKNLYTYNELKNIPKTQYNFVYTKRYIFFKPNFIKNSIDLKPWYGALYEDKLKVEQNPAVFRLSALTPYIRKDMDRYYWYAASSHFRNLRINPKSQEYFSNAFSRKELLRIFFNIESSLTENEKLYAKYMLLYSTNKYKDKEFFSKITNKSYFAHLKSKLKKYKKFEPDLYEINFPKLFSPLILREPKKKKHTFKEIKLAREKGFFNFDIRPKKQKSNQHTFIKEIIRSCDRDTKKTK